MFEVAYHFWALTSLFFYNVGRQRLLAPLDSSCFQGVEDGQHVDALPQHVEDGGPPRRRVDVNSPSPASSVRARTLAHQRNDQAINAGSHASEPSRHQQARAAVVRVTVSYTTTTTTDGITWTHHANLQLVNETCQNAKMLIKWEGGTSRGVGGAGSYGWYTTSQERAFSAVWSFR